MQIFRLYIDESGDHSYGKKELQKWVVKLKEDTLEVPIDHYPELERDDKRYLGLTGCIIEFEEYRNIFQPNIEKLKQKYFPHNPDEPVIFHRKDIINKHSPFWRLRDQNHEKAFNEDLISFLRDEVYGHSGSYRQESAYRAISSKTMGSGRNMRQRGEQQEEDRSGEAIED